MEHFIGNPNDQANFWELQNKPDNCAVAAQTSILNQFLDDPISLDEATYFAQANGWYSPGFGTSPDDIANILQASNIPCHFVDNATIQQLASELEQGHRVIVGVNSNDLWEEQGALTEFWHWLIQVCGFDNSTFQPADHAVVVTGLDLSDKDHPQVVINDSGDPNGAGHRYPLDRFMDAWGNSDFHYAATSMAPPGAAPLNFSISDLLGWGTAIGGTLLGMDPVIACQAGDIIAELSHNASWDSILLSI